MFIMTFNNKTETIAELTSDRRKLANSIVSLNAEGSTAMYDALDAALDHIKLGKHRKKVLVLITDGGDNKSRLRFSHLIDRVRESDVLLYTVGMYGGMVHNPAVARMTGRAQTALRALGETTCAYADSHEDVTNYREAMDTIGRE